MAEALIYKSLEPIRNQIKKIWLLNKSINIIHGISKALLFVLPLLAFACLADWNKAKAMHKEEIEQAHFAPKYGCFNEQYYNETFNK